MRYVTVGGKKAVHIATTSMDRDSIGSTLCGLSGDLQVQADSEVTKVCAKCTKLESA